MTTRSLLRLTTPVEEVVRQAEAFDWLHIAIAMGVALLLVLGCVGVARMRAWGRR